MKKDNKKHAGGKAKDKKDIFQIKDYVPSNLIDQVIPQQPLKKPSVSTIPGYNPEHIPNSLFPEWENKSTEELNRETEENFSDNSNLFYDEDHIKISSNLPFSLILQTKNNIEWKRPSEYVLNYYLDHQIQISYPKKNYITTRENMIQFHIKTLREAALKSKMKNNKENEIEEEDEDEDIDFFLKEDEEMRKLNMYKDLLSILSKKYEYKIVNTTKTLIENDEEIKVKEDNTKKGKRKKEVNKNIEQEKNGKDICIIEEGDKKYMVTIKPSNIYLKNFINDEFLHNQYYSWISSVYQLIIDLNIPDIETNKSIFSNIYPQNNGIPYYNPKGKYILKLYQHGKPRKVVIDDRMPCNLNSEYILPQCQEVEELWPAIFFKGLIKLNMYKIRHPSYYFNEEFMDTNIIYSLTGMQVITFDLNVKLLSLFKNKFIISEENNKDNKENNKEKNEKKFFALYAKKITKKMNLNKSKSYYDVQNELDFRNHLSGNYINNYNLQGKNIIPVQKGEKIFLRAREKSGSIIQKTSNLFEKSNNILGQNNNIKNKNIKDKEKEIKNKEGNNMINAAQITFEENKETEEIQKSDTNKAINDKKNNFQRSPYKKQTAIMKEISISTGELKKKNKKIDLIDQKNNIIYNYLYSVDDFFCNENFNMNRLNFLDFSDLIKELQDKKVEFKRLPADKKRQYILERKKLKSEKLEEKKRRIKSLKENGNTYNLIHIINQGLTLPKLEYFSEYSSENVELAKKCLLNGWMFPPPSIFQTQFEKADEEQKLLKKLKNLEDKVIPGKKTKKEKEKTEKPIGMFSWTKEMYEELIGGKDVLDSYKNNNKIPKKSKIKDGGWITFEDICNKFNKLIIIQNTKLCYKENLYVDNVWNYYKTDEFHPSEDNAIFLFVKTPIEDISSDDIGDMNNNKNEQNNKKKQINKKKDKNKKVEEEKSESEISHSELKNNNNPNCSILIIFEPLNEDFKLNYNIKEIMYPYISFDLIEKDTNIQIKKNIILSKFYSVFYYPYLSKEKEYFIKINGSQTPYGYNLQIFSDFYKIQHISINNFLKKFFSFQEFNTSVETSGPIEKNKNYMLAKVSFVLKEGINYDKLKFKIDIKHEFYFLKKYISVFLVKDNPYYKKEIETEKIFSFISKNKFSYINNLKPNEEYYFVFYIKPEMDLPETEFNIKILYNNPNITINEINNLEPFEINDIYYKNKDSILFSYFVYSSEKIYSSFDINFIRYKLKDGEEINNNNTKLIPNKNNQSNSIIPFNENFLKNKDKYQIIPLSDNEHYHIILELYQLTKEPSLDFVNNAMKFSYSNQGNLIRQWKFSNTLSVSNCIFIGDVISDSKKKKATGNKNEKNDEEEKKTFPYVLLCYVDVQKVSDLNIPEDIGFIFRVYASNNISFIKDKTKEEHEKKLKEKWEENDEGRSKLAIKSRIKFLVYAKNLKKEKLDENELKILNEDRQRRSANEIDHIVSIDENEGKGAKKKGKKNEGNKGDNNKNKIALSKNKSNLSNNEDDENMSGSNLFNKNIINLINKKARPLSMASIFKHKKQVFENTKSNFILNFVNYSSKDRTIYKNLKKTSLLKKNNILRNRKIIISDEAYRQKLKSNILSRYEASENELKKNNEDYFNISRGYFEKINNYSKDLSKQRRAQSINTESLLKRRKKMQDYIQSKLDKKKEILTGIEENQKFLENMKKNKKELNNKKGESINYEEQIKLYKEAKALLEKDTDVIKFFNILSNIKEEELKIEYERIKSSNDKNKEGLFLKIMEDIKNNKWNISSEFMEKLQKEVDNKNKN